MLGGAPHPHKGRMELLPLAPLPAPASSLYTISRYLRKYQLLRFGYSLYTIPSPSLHATRGRGGDPTPVSRPTGPPARPKAYPPAISSRPPRASCPGR